MRTYVETIQSIVGENGLRSILHYAHLEKYIETFPPRDDKVEIPVQEVRALFRSLTILFGDKGVRGLQLRVGREISRNALEGRPAIAKTIKMAARLLPEIKKMRFALDKLAEQVKQSYTFLEGVVPVEVKEEEDCFLIYHRVRFESEGVTSRSPVCNVFVGMIQYFMEWITGHPHEVVEVECRAMGSPADVFKVMKAHQE